MALSPRMGWSYPNENVNPWYEAFKSLVLAMDVSGYASREDRNLIIVGGGLVSWDAGTSLLSWADVIQVLSFITGYRVQTAANTVTMDDGYVLYLSVTRSPTSNVTVSVVVDDKIPTDDSAFVLAVRSGTNIYWRNGLMMESGDSVIGLGSKQVIKGVEWSIDLGKHFYTQLAVPIEEDIGQFMMDGSKVSSFSSVRFRCQMTSTFSVPGNTQVRLYDLGAVGTPAAPVQVTGAPSHQLIDSAGGLVYLETDPFTFDPITPSVGVLVTGPRMYQARLIQGSALGDTVDLGFSGMYSEV